jgi:hypothetical protein
MKRNKCQVTWKITERTTMEEDEDHHPGKEDIVNQDRKHTVDIRVEMSHQEVEMKLWREASD